MPVEDLEGPRVIRRQLRPIATERANARRPEGRYPLRFG